jgi:hypothetical protein
MNIDKSKFLIISLLVGIAIGIVVILVLLFQDDAKKDTGVTGAVKTLPTTDGGSIEVANFSETAQVYDRAEVIYSDSNYTIQYENVERTFQITFTILTLEELRKYRFEAEDKLLKTLGLSQEQGCRIPVIERVLSNAEEVDLPQGSFAMSFCIGGENIN